MCVAWLSMDIIHIHNDSESSVFVLCDWAWILCICYIVESYCWVYCVCFGCLCILSSCLVIEYVWCVCIGCLNTCVVYGLGLGLCGLTPLPTIFPLYCGGLLYWRKKLEYSEKTADLPLVTDKLDKIILYRIHLTVSRIRNHNFSGDRHWLYR